MEDSIPKFKSRIKDSWSFAESIRNVKIGADEILISFDVTSLFTNIPKGLLLRGIEKEWDSIATTTCFSLSQFLHAIEVVLNSTSFAFNGQIYEQIFGPNEPLPDAYPC